MADRNKVKWDEVDWSESDDTIARQHGCSTNLVWKNRRRLGKQRAHKIKSTSPNEKLAIRRPRKCHCGAAAVDKWRGDWLCYDCLIGDDSDLVIDPWAGYNSSVSGCELEIAADHCSDLIETVLRKNREGKYPWLKEYKFVTVPKS